MARPIKLEGVALSFRRAGLGQVLLAERLGTSQSTINRRLVVGNGPRWEISAQLASEAGGMLVPLWIPIDIRNLQEPWAASLRRLAPVIARLPVLQPSVSPGLLTALMDVSKHAEATTHRLGL